MVISKYFLEKKWSRPSSSAYGQSNIGTNEEQRNTNEGWKLANISAAEMSDLETLLKQKTFTRYEIERLTRLGDGDKANISNDSHVLRLKASKSGPLNKHAEERENFHAVISTPRAFEEDVPSPILLAKPRSRGRTAMYRMARSPYYRGRSTLSKKPTPSLIYSQPAWELEGSNGSKMAGKSRSFILDDLGSGGSMRRIRQKANLHPAVNLYRLDYLGLKGVTNGSKLPGKSRSSVLDESCDLWFPMPSLSKHKSEFDSSAIVENGETRMRNSGYGFVPIKSTQMASKILEHLERTAKVKNLNIQGFVGTTMRMLAIN
ncbi:hypothetical protein Tco_1207325 [Tanacetum coccineum]